MNSSNTEAARKDEAAQDQTTDEQSQKDDWQDHIAKIIEYSKQLKEDYHTQGKITHQLAKAEWKLSLRSMALITIFLGCFASGLILLWAGLLGAIGYGMYDLFGSVWLSIATAALAQIICLVWLWRNTVYLGNKIGFSRTIKSLKQLFNL
ncbi:hypothetical protein [Pseudoalteromonas sp. MMG007]|uniref:hypothetical protein n=1 Tax=Pseudoalteromonas sp. MMG007 TaxID=2822684 RepID=UPI001B38CEE8|nr:hypothetical protein [Pseudoalteromonas sp. MMG007]MBQ4856849.1 hypothetical protein [Pseudoalteromonas sp. MMG007]